VLTALLGGGYRVEKVKTSIKPLGNRVVVKAVAREETTRSGIVLPDTAKEKPQEGEVVAVGPGRVAEDGTRIPMELKAGDTVIYAKYAGSEVKLDDEEYLIISETDVLAVLSR
jgi:chaperonin GroES